jgi:hypothetical protein
MLTRPLASTVAAGAGFAMASGRLSSARRHACPVRQSDGYSTGDRTIIGQRCSHVPGCACLRPVEKA